MKPETAVKQWVRTQLQAHLPNVYVAFIHQSMYSSKGIPDIIGCYRGVFFAIEVKTETGKTTKLQDIELAKIADADGISEVIYGKDKNKMLAICKELVHRATL